MPWRSPRTPCGTDAGRGAPRDGARRPGAGRATPALVDERAARVPLQHLTGRAPLPPADPRGRSGRLRAATRDRGDGRARDRRGIRAWGRMPSSSTCAPGRGRSRSPSRTSCRAPGCSPSSCPTSRTAGRWRNRDRLGLDVEVRLGDATTAFDDLEGRGRRGGEQPAVHPRRCGAGRPRGARPRPRGRALRRRRPTAWPCRWPSPPARRCCCGPAGCSSWSTPTARAPRCRTPCAATGEWAEVADHADLSGRPRTTVAVRGDGSRHSR